MIKNPNVQWDREVIIDVLMACVMFHNMIIENKVRKFITLEESTMALFTMRNN